MFAQYIRVCLDNAADAEGSNIALVLTNMGAASCFRFRSRHNLKLADDPVCHLDTVFVVPEDLADSHFLNCDVDLAKLMHTWPPKLKHSVSALLTGMTCLIQKYSREVLEPAAYLDPLAAASGKQKFIPLHYGQVVRLFHPRLDVFLATSPSMASSNKTLMVLEDANGFDQPGAATRLEQPSAYSMWIVESADPTRGSPLLFDQPIRLRNLATDGYLCPNKGLSTVIAKEIVTWSASGPSNRTMTSSVCSFCRLAENSGDDGHIGKHTVVWIGFPSLESQGGGGDAKGGDAKWLQTAGSVSSPSLELLNQLRPTDGFVVYPVHEPDLMAPFQIVSVAHTVREYITLIKEHGFSSYTAVQTQRIIGILKGLIKLFEKSSSPSSNANISDGKTGGIMVGEQEDDHDMEDRERSKSNHHDIYKSQTIIRELQLMDNLVELVDFHKWSHTHLWTSFDSCLLLFFWGAHGNEVQRMGLRHNTRVVYSQDVYSLFSSLLLDSENSIHNPEN